jgi:hypothetical protein
MYQIRSPSPQSIANARRRLGSAERSVELLRSILTEAAPASEAATSVRAWLNERERSLYCRRLELDALLRQRRQALPLTRGDLR